MNDIKLDILIDELDDIKDGQRALSTTICGLIQTNVEYRRLIRRLSQSVVMLGISVVLLGLVALFS